MTLAGKRLLIDASMSRGGGGFTYMANVVPALAEIAPEAHVVVLLRNPDLADALPRAPNVEVRLLPECGLVGRLRFMAREAPRLAADARADLFFSVAEYAPLGAPCPVVVSLRNPNVFTSLDQGWPPYQRARLGALRRLAVRSARRAARVVFVSHDSARWMGEAAGIEERRRAVVHHGMDPEAFMRRHASIDRDAVGILSVSTIYRYKNFVRLIEAYGLLADRISTPPRLTIVGDDQDPKYSGMMRDARAGLGSLAERVDIVGAVPYMEIAAYYAAAQLFAFPSYLETFGHPLLEAMAAGLPIVAADIPVFREIAREAAVYANPHEPQAIADALAHLLEDAALRGQCTAAGGQRLGEFGWQRAAARLAELFEEILAR